MVQIGDIIPDLLGIDQEGHELRRSQYEGKYIALYFYPKDNTAGCTTQACNLRDNYSLLSQNNIVIIGVSRDSASSHQRFITKHALPFPLIVDSEGKLNEAFGVWVEKSMYGRKYMGTERTTFLINPQGVVEHIIRGKAVKTAEHSAQILALLQ